MSEKMLRGRAHSFGDNIDTDAIIPARYMVTSEPAELAKHVMEDADPDFAKNVRRGDFIVAKKNFGCGSSREHAPVAIKAAGVGCVIAKSYARIFYRNAFNTGLPIFESSDAPDKIRPGDELTVDMNTGVITNLTKNEKYTAAPIPEFMQKLLADGGLMASIKKKIS